MSENTPKKNKGGRPRVGAGNGKKIGPMSAFQREKISKSKVLARLIDHAEGNLKDASGPKSPMTASQVSAGIALLKKIMADKTQSDVEVKAEVDQVVAKINIVGVEPEEAK